MAESRKRNTIKNFVFSLSSYILNMGLSFATRTVFIYCLTTEYLGVSGLFTNILSLLSLAELGAGGAFVSLLYKPIAEGDEQKLAVIMKTFKKVYFFMALFVGAVGLSLTPFLKYIIAENSIEKLPLIYILFILNSVVAYVCAAEKALVKANQKMYVITTITQVASIVQYAGQIVVLLLTHNYILFLLVQIICTMAGNIYVSFYSKKKYPYLSRKAEKMDKETKRDVIQKIRGGFCVHAGYVIASGTDSIVISHFLSLTVLGIYSNYLLIIGILQKLVMMIFDSVRASASNFAVSSDPEENYAFFKKMNFLIMMLMGFITTCLIVLFNPFIRLWAGSDYLLDFPLVILASLINFVGWHGIKLPMAIYRDALGLYYKDRYIALLEGILNIVISVVLVRIIGLAGVFLGTIISSVCTTVSGSYLIFKYCFKKSSWYYWRSLLTYLVVISGVAVGAYFLVGLVTSTGWLSFILKTAICVVAVAAAYVLIFHRREEFRYYLDLIKGIGRRKKKS
ncbi:MAG: oligosaccharide flippase family protein [Clostridia bacterium]|nr:oligosaccharide flippase family protein [Clostridia bacterium]